MNYKAICLTISLLAAAAPATALELCGDFNQGEIIIGKTEDEASTVTFNQKQYPITEDGYFILAFGRDQNAEAELQLSYPHDASVFYKLPVKTYQWDIQRINGVSQQK